ncbi:xylulokinase [Agrococcus versicolor]|uniref:Xylulokinase n=1 Tax=Agrococcus versicolor TaxID=501482 RepID=A0ABP5MSD4_9MICO
MRVYAVDLGTTNTKVVLFDERLRRLAIASAPTDLVRSGDRVELSAPDLLETVLRLIRSCASRASDAGDMDAGSHHAVIALTGQAESLVLVDADGRDVRPAISWLDDRASIEAAELGERFDAAEAFAITGEPTPSTTWPAAKLRWLARHEPDALERTERVLMLKDDLVRRLTGRALGERTTRGFTYLHDVLAGTPWSAMLDFVSISAEQLPTVVAAGADAGVVREAVAAAMPPAASWRVNVGALDHFCAMVGTGSYLPGVVSESAGTVLSLSMLAGDFAFDPAHSASFHAGIADGDVVLFSGVDGGGISLEWFRREGLAGMPYDELETALLARGRRVRPSSAPVFLPYLTGVAPPDLFASARGAFLGLDLAHDRIDMAYAVQEGVAHILRRNVDAFGGARQIVSTGGGTASAHWNQLKADACGVDLLVPDEEEATCRGAAVLALVEAGELATLADADDLALPTVTRYRPRDASVHDERYRLFDDGLRRLFG